MLLSSDKCLSGTVLNARLVHLVGVVLRLTRFRVLRAFIGIRDSGVGSPASTRVVRLVASAFLAAFGKEVQKFGFDQVPTITPLRHLED